MAMSIRIGTAVPRRQRLASERTGRNPIERKAVYRVQRDIAAMPASLVVQLALWPDEVAAWARAEGSSESLVYNMLAGRKPYARVRERLARRLAVSVGVLSHLIEAERPLPSAKVPAPLFEAAQRGDGDTQPIEWTVPRSRFRDGGNPIERSAVRRVELEIASMPASAVVGLALWPDTLAEWSRVQQLKSSVVWATLSGSPSEPVRSALVRRLGVDRSDLDELIAARRREPASAIPAMPPNAHPDAHPDAHRDDLLPPAFAPTRSAAATPPPAVASGGEQMTLDL